MICPKCGMEQPDAPECKQCGVLVAKFRPQEARPRPGAFAGAKASAPPAPSRFSMSSVITGVIMVIFIITITFTLDLPGLYQSGVNKLIIALIAAGFVILVLWLWQSGKKRRERFEGLAAGLGGEVDTNSDYLRLKTEAGEAWVFLVASGGENSSGPEGLVLELRTPISFSFAVRKNNVAYRALGHLGMKIISRDEFKIGDPRFDEKYLIQGKDQTRITRFFQDPGRREAVEYFFRNGFKEIKTDSQTLITWKEKYKEADLEPSLIRSHLEQLCRLAAKENE